MKTIQELSKHLEEVRKNYNALTDVIGTTSISKEGKLRMEALDEIDNEITWSNNAEELIEGLQDNIANNKYSDEVANLITKYIKNTIAKEYK